MDIYFKYLSLTATLILSTIVAIAQKQASDRIYWLALEKYTHALDSSFHINSKGNKIYLQKPECVDSIPPKINGYDVILITGENQKKLYREHNNTLTHTRMFPVAVEDSLLCITITPYSGKLKGHSHYFLSVSDGTTIYFRFDSIKKQFVVDKVKNWGI